jgi:hypothetical protein
LMFCANVATTWKALPVGVASASYSTSVSK